MWQYRTARSLEWEISFLLRNRSSVSVSWPYSQEPPFSKGTSLSLSLMGPGVTRRSSSLKCSSYISFSKHKPSIWFPVACYTGPIFSPKVNEFHTSRFKYTISSKDNGCKTCWWMLTQRKCFKRWSILCSCGRTDFSDFSLHLVCLSQMFQPTLALGQPDPELSTVLHT